MFTAKQFLQNTDYDLLPGIIRSDPIRLRKEFIAIATDQKEDYLFRFKSLRILNGYAQVFGLFTFSEQHTLIMAFESEFPLQRLEKIADIVRSGASRYMEPLLVFYYCVAIARITLNDADDIVNATREIFKGSYRERTLENHLDTIEQFKTYAVRFNQMEAG